MISKLKYLITLSIIFFVNIYSQDYLVPPRSIFSYNFEDLQYFSEFNKRMLNQQKPFFRGDALEIVHLSYSPSEWAVWIYGDSPENKLSYELICNVSDSTGRVTRSFDYPEKRISFLRKCKIKTYTKRISLLEGSLILKAYKKLIYDPKQLSRFIIIGEPDEEFYTYNDQYAMHRSYGDGIKCTMLYKISGYLKQYSTCEKKNEEYFMSLIFDNCYKILNSTNEEKYVEDQIPRSIDYRGLTYLKIVAAVALVLSIIVVATKKKRVGRR